MLAMLHIKDVRARTFGSVKKSSAVEILHEAKDLALMGEMGLRALAVFYTSLRSIE